jgi:hypothetical protein
MTSADLCWGIFIGVYGFVFLDIALFKWRLVRMRRQAEKPKKVD